MKIIYLPLEHIETRYTKHLDRDICAYLEQEKLDYVRIYPNIPERKLKPGHFLDASTTIEFKSKQIADIAAMYYTDEINSGDIIFTSDLWMPGIESIAYLNHFTGKDVKLRGIMHAGSWTDTDEVRHMERWAKCFEDVLFDISEKIFVASNFIKNDIIKKRIVDKNKISVTPFPLDVSEMRKHISNKKENIVIFNGRQHPEKQPWLFNELKNAINNTQIQFINTQELNLSKQEYYKLLGKSKVVVSFALQENYGFGINEAVYMGCIPVLPNRLVYPEQYPPMYLYNTFDECCAIVEQAMYSSKMICPKATFSFDSITEWFKQ